MTSRPVQGGSANTWGTQLNAWLDENLNTVFNVAGPAYGAVVYTTEAAAISGLSDSTAAVNAAITAANADGGGYVLIPGWIYIATNLTLLDNVVLIGTGPDSSGIVFSDTDDFGIQAQGSATAKTITADVARDSRSFTITTSGLAAGDWMLCQDSTAVATGDSTNTKPSFIDRILTVVAGSPDTINLEGRMPLAYSAASGQFRKITMRVGAGIRDLGFRTTATIGSTVNRRNAVFSRYSLSFYVRNCRFVGFCGNAGSATSTPGPVYIEQARDAQVTNCIFDRNYDTGLVTASGSTTNTRALEFDICTAPLADANTFIRCGGSKNLSFQRCLFPIASNNTISGHPLSNIRSPADTGSFVGDTGGRGISIERCYHSVVSANTIRNIAYVAIMAVNCPYSSITGNVLYNWHDQGILIQSTSTASAPFFNEDITVTGNSLRYSETTGTNGEGIYIDGLSYGTISGNTIRDIGPNDGIVLNGTYCNVIGNTIVNAGNVGGMTITGANCTGNNIIGNNIQAVTTGAAIDSTGAAGGNSVSSNFVDTAKPVSLHANDSFVSPIRKFVLTYSATVAPDCSTGEYFTLAATNTTAYTISNPTHATSGYEITFDIKNSSAGTMGVVTWGGAFLLAGAFVNPANTKRRTISFRYDGTNWIETGRAAADI